MGCLFSISSKSKSTNTSGIYNLALWLCFALLACATAGKTWAEPAKAFFWEVESNNATVFLMGSIHMATPAFYPLRKEMTQAFAQSDYLVVEADVSGPQALAVQQMALTKGVYSTPDGLKRALKPSTYSKLQAYLAANNLPAQLFNRYKPSFLAMTLASLELAKRGMLPEFGIDMHFLNQARGNKPILELESVTYQLDLILNLPNQEAMLQQTLDELPIYDEMIKTLHQSWQTGDEQALEDQMLTEPLTKHPETKESIEILFFERNRAMTQKIKGYLKGQDSYFVIVGAGHLIGGQGIVAELQEAGYRVTRR